MAESIFFKKMTKEYVFVKFFFKKTLCISHGSVDKALAGVDEAGILSGTDQRGNRASPNKTDLLAIQRVESQIDSFPTVESYYCRKTTKKS